MLLIVFTKKGIVFKGWDMRMVMCIKFGAFLYKIQYFRVSPPLCQRFCVTLQFNSIRSQY